MNTIQFSRTPLACVVASGLIVSICGCASPQIVESYAYGAGALRTPRDAVTYYLPRQLVDIEVERAAIAPPGVGVEDRFTLRLRAPVPDIRRRFYVRLKPEGKYTVQTTEAGLLTSANAPVTDGVPQFLGSVALLPEATRSAAQPRACTPVDGLSIAPPMEARPFTTTITVDPTVPADLARGEGQLCSLGARYRFVLTRVGTGTPRVITSAPDELDVRKRHLLVDNIGGRDQYPGLVYRRREPYVFEIYKEQEGMETVRFVGAVQVSLPNLAPPERMAFPELAIATREGVVFRDGMLVARTGVPVQRRRGIEIRFESGSDGGDPPGGAALTPNAQTNSRGHASGGSNAH